MHSDKKDVIIVGIGASAGGLSVLKNLVKIIPKNSGLAYVIVQHLDPNHDSMLSEILAKDSEIPVQAAQNGIVLHPNQIYVIQPNTYLEIIAGKIKLIEPQHTRGLRMPIDHFFRSLANLDEGKCIGMILSGSGSDGTAGLRAIKASGGLALVQDPDTAEHAGMPFSAIQAGVVDKIIKINDLPNILANYGIRPLMLDDKSTNLQSNNIGDLEEVTDILSKFEGFNLNQYKHKTVYRRITRRMNLIGSENFQEYLKTLNDNGDERKKLTKDLLINVTDFFRDTEAFEILENEVIPNIISKINEDEDIRVWVAGCASGEEAYSIGILLLEAVEKAEISNEIKIFATDIDDFAIKIARKGNYPESIVGEVPKAMMEKYFIQYDDGSYQIKSKVRDIISFANQNVATHPPFSHMHLISCRNLLIYLKAKVQEKVLNSFYFSMEDDSYLFLGSSESIGDKTNFFKSVSKKWRIYKKILGKDKENNFLHHFNVEKENTENINFGLQDIYSSKKKINSRADRIRSSLLESKVPPTIVVDYNGRILYNHGSLKPYITVPTGEPRNDISKLVIPSVQSRLRSSLYKIKKSNQKQIFHCSIPVDEANNQKMEVKVEVALIYGQNFDNGSAIAISFHEGKNLIEEQNKNNTQYDEKKFNYNLEIELAETKEELQNTIEELDANGEELKALHEEALSTNEELQSANEELEASSEELRSLNEEISTVNAQLKEKIVELQNANNDVENFFSSTDIPTVFLNTNLEIQRYTPAAEQLLKMGPQDVGRPIFNLGRDLIDDELSFECKKVLQNFQPIRKEKKTFEGRWYIRQITPYRTGDMKIDGVVIVFQEVTEIKILSRRAESREQQQSVVAKLGILAMQGVEPEELMHQAVRQVAHVLNADYCKILNYQPDKENFRMVAGVGWRPGLVGKVTVPNDYNSQAGYTLLTKEPIIVKKLSEEKRFEGPELLNEHEVVSGISCLINHTDPPYGVIGVHSKNYIDFTKDDANFLVSVANMISIAVKAREDQEKLHFSEEQFRTMANSIPQLSWITDEKGYIYWYNQRWYDYTGTTLKDVEGWKWKSVHHPAHINRVVEKFKDHINIGKAWEDTFPLRGADGKFKWFLSRAEPIKNKQGEIIQWLGTNTDITERQSLETSLRSAITQLEETDKKKNEFLAVLGHELRNPLAALRSSLEFLQINLDAPKNILNIMGRSVFSMTKILDDLLDLSRISKNKINLQLNEVNISSLLNNNLDNVKRQFEKKNQNLQIDVSDELYIKADTTRLEQIFSNVLLNANKYTQDGGKIEVKAWSNNEKVFIEVKDDGIGIEKENLDKIFDAFYQIPLKGKAASGLGIGLSLVKNLVELHGGTIEVFSEGLNKGTRFQLTFNKWEEKMKADTKVPKTENKVSSGVSVVLVEDNEDIVTIFSMILKRLNCDLSVAKNGKDALKIINEKQPAVAFIDIGLPDMTGYEIASSLRSNGYSKKLIAASGYSHEEAKKQSKDAGFDDHLAKPLSRKDIISILSQFE